MESACNKNRITVFAARDAKAAQESFTQDVGKNPKNPRSLLGLSEALNAQGKRAQADAGREAFMRVEQHGDVQLAIGSL